MANVRGLGSFEVRAVVGLLAVALAGCRAGSTDAIETRLGATVGGDSHDVTGATALPPRAVGWIDVAFNGPNRGECTATPILRDIVVTAGHCLSDHNGEAGDIIMFHLPHPDATGAIVDTQIQSASFQFTTLVDPTGFNEPGNAAIDLGIVRLSRGLNTTELPQLPQIYTNQDFLDRVFNFKEIFSSNPFFQGPVETTGFDESIPDHPERRLATVNPVNFDKGKVFSNPLCTGGILCSDDAAGYWIHDDINTVQHANQLILEHGDSGSPIMFRQHGTDPTIFGVGSVFHNTHIDNNLGGFTGAFVVENGWSPTWDNGVVSNGLFIRQFLSDADNDGVSDATDNCKPPNCTGVNCFNPDQTDTDNDGVGDACDNCPGIVCSGAGVDASLCANTAQEDRGDHDGVGDVCDTCPGMAAGILFGDRDADRIGDACDNCPFLAGGRRACRADSDCGGRGFCIRTNVQGGRCNDSSNRSCNTFLGSRTCSCVEVGTWGICSESDQPDTDGDGIGNACDNCPNVADANLQQNSNLASEQRTGVTQLNDICDPTPVFASRPVVEPSGNGARTLFTAFAGIGSDTTTPHAAFAGPPVGFRHCDCSPDISAVACEGQCSTDPIHFDTANDPIWKLVTIGASPAANYNESAVTAPTLDQRVSDVIYTAGVDCSDPKPHQTVVGTIPVQKDNDLCRLGIGSGRLVSWQTQTDITAGRVASFSRPITPISGEPQNPAIVVQTLGMFWSHGTLPVPFSGGQSTRDTLTAGNLRNHYTHVATPSVAFDARNVPRFAPITPINCAINPQCRILMSRDWLRNVIFPGIGTNVLRLTTRPFVIHPDCTGTGIMCAIRRSTEPHIDLGLVFSDFARQTLNDTGRFFLTPVERVPQDASMGGGFIAASVPRDWSQLTSDIRIIGLPSEGNSLDVVRTMQAVPPSESNSIPFGGPGFVPGDRTGARMLFSAAEQSIYMIGGARGTTPTSEVWRLDIASATWTHLLQQPATHPVSIRNVGAVGYDSALGKFLIVDDAPASSPQNARLVVLDRNGNTSKVAATLNIGGFTKVGLTATGNGTFVLVGARASDWTAYRLQVTAANGITWLGRASGTGLVLADPIPWQEGPGVFVQRGSDIDTTDLPPGAFTPSGTPPELGVCTAPPVVGTLPPVTVASCSAGVLVPPPLASACGPVTFTHNAPAVLPLGTTVVTWRFTDALGNVVTAQQSVTTQLGDDATCCPAGTNIIMGTSNNDVLTGTAGNDCIIALGGQDTVNGGGGDDVISGGEGDDILNGQAGNDRIYGGGGQDTLNGGDGADQLFGGSGDDRCFGGIGNDLLSGGDGQDTLNGEDGNDTLRGDNGDDRLSGGNGNDSLDGGGNNNACSGGAGTNTFVRCQTFF
jgi:hypothetical protein